MDHFFDDDKFFQGHGLLAEDEYAQAADKFTVAIKDYPEMEGAWGNRGYALLQIGKDREALTDFEMVIKLKPDDAFGHAFKAVALYNLKQYSPALASAAHAIEIADSDEDVPPARAVRAWLFARAGQFASAYHDLEVFFEYSEDDGLLPLFETCHNIFNGEPKLCNEGPEGKLDCRNCLNSSCGYSFNILPNPDWEKHDGRCQYSHCIETLPHRNGMGSEICPVFWHDCPGGKNTLSNCPTVLSSQYLADESDNPFAADEFADITGFDFE